MKTPEDEAFEDIERKQGMWGGGFPAKRAMAADKLQEPLHVVQSNGKHSPLLTHMMNKRTTPSAHCQCTACKTGIIHASDCAVHNGPAYPAGPCDCGVAQEPVDKLYHSTEARWCENFVEVKHPHIENEIVRFYFTQPVQRPWVGLEKSDMPDGENPMFDHEYFIAGIVFASNVLKEKNT